MTRSLFCALFITLALSHSASAQEKKESQAPISQRYKLSINTDFKAQLKDEIVPIQSKMAVIYENKQRGNSVDIWVHGFKLALKVNDSQQFDMVLDKDSLVEGEGEEATKLNYEDGDDDTKNAMDILRARLAEVALDKQGKESSRSFTKKTTELMNVRSMLLGVRWFHPQYPVKSEFVEEREFDMNEGGPIKGPLTFKTIPGKKSENTVVKLSGVMTKEKAQSETAKFSNIKYVFSGTQVFDKKRKIWIRGETTVKASFTMKSAEGLSQVTGVLKLKLTPLKDGELFGEGDKNSRKRELKGVVHSYKVTVNTAQTIDYLGQKFPINVATDLRYDNELRAGKSLTISLKKLYLLAYQNGKETIFFNMNRDLFQSRQGGQEIDSNYSDANENQRAILAKLFRSKFATIELSENGSELKRVLYNKVNGRELFGNLIHNIRWFHVSSPRKDSWTEERTFDLGRGGVLSGPLTYTKLKKDSNSNITRVKVSGTLTRAKVRTKKATLLDVKYSVEGTQSYDEKKKIWIKGAHTVKVSYTALIGIKQMKTSGTITLTLSMPEKK